MDRQKDTWKDTYVDMTDRQITDRIMDTQIDKQTNIYKYKGTQIDKYLWADGQKGNMNRYIDR